MSGLSVFLHEFKPPASPTGLTPQTGANGNAGDCGTDGSVRDILVASADSEPLHGGGKAEH